ncbi:MAG: Na+/H+ antiporter NhaC family protein [Gammaproteobacteria bacterium]|nr:Na+/H+ antiporter NhaC family protein [Gammaproteobacteria bacterium]
MDSFLSIAPSLLALTLAFTTKRVIFSLFSAVTLGFFILNDYQVLTTAVSIFEKGIFLQLQGSNAQIIIVITIISGFIYLLEASNVMRAFSTAMSHRVQSNARVKLSTFFSGIAIFFTDSGNSLILGPVFRPIYDKLKICREKLAYIVDSTSSPVCVLIPVISWGAYTMGLMEQAYESEGIAKDGFVAFREVWFYQLYPLLTLGGVFFVASLNLYIGRMAHAQQSLLEGKLTYDDSEIKDKPLSANQLRFGARVTLMALGTLFASMLLMFTIFVSRTGGLDGPTIRVVLAMSYTLATIVTIAALSRFNLFSLSKSSASFFSGMGKIMPILCILILAWTMSDVLAALDTGGTIAALLKAMNFPSWMLASMIFLVGACLSLATGSSWGTFALIIPIVVPLATALEISVPICLGAALSGGLFGDQTSPISDTTVLSSMSSGVSHMAHVETQFPYALITAGFTFFGFILASLVEGFGPMYLSVALMLGLLGLFYWYLSRYQLVKAVNI